MYLVLAVFSYCLFIVTAAISHGRYPSFTRNAVTTTEQAVKSKLQNYDMSTTDHNVATNTQSTLQADSGNPGWYETLTPGSPAPTDQCQYRQSRVGYRVKWMTGLQRDDHRNQKQVAERHVMFIHSCYSGSEEG